MNVITTTDNLEQIQSQILVLPFFSDDKNLKGKLIKFDKTQGGRIKNLLSWGDIKAKYKEFTMFYTGGVDIERILVIGLGEKKEFTPDRLRSVMAIAARNGRRINCSSMCVYGYNTFGLSKEDYGRCIIEGILLGLYKFTKYISQSSGKAPFILKELKIIVDSEEQVKEISCGVEEGLILCDATNLARDLVNEPAMELTPAVFAEHAEQIASTCGMDIKILEKEDMKKLGMGGILAVSQGSDEPPKMVIINYKGNPGGKTVGLIGKGVTFDSGGLSIKSDSHLFRMNCDMAGAAAVLGALKAIAVTNLKVNILAVMPLTENLPDGRAYKVSDIIKTFEGKTVEILSTDAEGRLILADGLSYARREGADILIDIATLTGSIVTALGHQTTGIMGTDKDIIKYLIKSGDKSGERIWELPLFPEYKMQIKSDVADLENYGGPPAGAITAAMFLEEFTGGLPWAHLDIAGTATTDEEIMIYVKNPYLPKEGGTGVGVRTLYHFIKDYYDSINISKK
jgi:leucyl aminopeptidase